MVSKTEKENQRLLQRGIDNLNAAFKFVKRPAQTRKYSEIAETEVVRRTLLGKGVDESGRTFQFPKLKESYIKQRKGQLIFFTNKK